jgi:hypothetical protein
MTFSANADDGLGDHTQAATASDAPGGQKL